MMQGVVPDAGGVAVDPNNRDQEPKPSPTTAPAPPERGRADDTLPGPQEMLELVVAHFPGVVFWKNRESVYVGCNQAFAHGAGLSDPKEIAGKTDYDLPWTRAETEAFRADDRAVIESSRPKLGIIEPQTQADGRIAWFDTSKVPLLDAGGRVVGVLGTSHDITTLKKTEETLHEERDFIEAVLETASAVIVVLDDQARIVRLNRAAEELVGQSFAELAGRPFLERMSLPEEAASMKDAFARLLAGEGPTHFVNHWRTRSSGRRLVSGTSTVLRREGEARFIIVSGIDITDRDLAEQERRRLLEEVQRRAAELRAVLENIVDGVWVVNPAGEIVLVNRAGLRLFGVAGTEEFAARLADELAHVRAADGSALRPGELAMSRALAGEVVQANDELIFNPRLGHHRAIRVTAAPFWNERAEVLGAVVVATDVSDLVELDHVKDEFLRIAAHELKTPVAIMKGYAQVLLRGVAMRLPETDQRKTAEAIVRGADRIDGIVRDLLDVMRLQGGRLELAHDRVDLRELAQQTIARFEVTTNRHQITLAGAEPVVVRGDLERLQQVLGHLIGNAIKYSPRGGAIEVSVEVIGAETQVSVTDHGIGIPQGRQTHIFERFYRAHSGTPYDYGGMGVGLYICREIVGQLGGRIWFESKEGEGSTFLFSLPCG